MKLQGTEIGRLIGHLGFLILIALSVVLAQERVLFVDSAAQLFEMIQRGTFVIYDHRYTMAVTQLLPLLGIKLGLPLPVLVVLYSAAAPLLGYLAFLLLAYKVKDVPLALLLLLPMFCLCHTFFHAISETFSLMIYATLLLALLRHSPHSILHTSLLVLAVLACVFMHPIGLFFVVFLLGFRLVEVGGRKPELHGILVAAATLVVAAAVKVCLPSGHDAGYIPYWADVVGCLRHPGEIPVVRCLLHGTASLYLVPLILYAVGLMCHIRHRQWLRLAWGVVFNVGFILLTAIVYRTDTSPVCVERAWLPLIFFAGVPVVSGEWKMNNEKCIVWSGILFILLLLSYGRIAHISHSYRARLDDLQKMVDRGRSEGHCKLVTPAADFSERWEVQSWATAFETLILSSLSGPDNSATLYLEEEEPFREDNPDYDVTDAYLAVPWNRLWNYSTLDPRYFRLPLQPTEVTTDGQ